MKKYSRLVAAVLTAVMLTAALLSGCGSSAPTEDDARKYVQALLDLMCKGEYDTSVKFSDVEEGKEQELRDGIIEDALTALAGQQGINDDIKDRFRTFFSQALSKCKYTVTNVEKTDDGGNVGYDVTVSIEPYKVYDGVKEALDAEITAMSNDSEALADMTEDELSGRVFDAFFDILNRNLENPVYGEAQEITVHYGLLDEEENAYGVDEAAGSRIGEKLFSIE